MLTARSTLARAICRPVCCGGRNWTWGNLSTLNFCSFGELQFAARFGLGRKVRPLGSLGNAGLCILSEIRVSLSYVGHMHISVTRSTAKKKTWTRAKSGLLPTLYDTRVFEDSRGRSRLNLSLILCTKPCGGSRGLAPDAFASRQDSILQLPTLRYLKIIRSSRRTYSESPPERGTMLCFEKSLTTRASGNHRRKRIQA